MKLLMITSEYPTKDFPHSVPFIEKQVHLLRKNGIFVNVFHFRGNKNPINYLRAWKNIQNKLKNENYDLIHAQWGQSGILALPKKVPLCVTFRGDDLSGIHTSKGKNTIMGLILISLSKFVAHYADERIVVSRALGQKLNPLSYHIIPTGVDLVLFSPKPKSESRDILGLSSKKKYILFGGNKSIQNKRFHLAKQVVELVDSLFISDVEMIVLEKVKHEMVPYYMNASDLLLLTSKSEGSPNVVKEALACDLPVVSTDVGDVKERIGKIKGCHVCSDDPNELAEAVIQVLNSNFQLNSRESVVELDENLLIQKNIAIYEQLIEKNKLNNNFTRP